MMCEAELYRELGNELLIRRQDLGLSQDDVLDRLACLGVDMCQCVYSRIESGTRPLRCHELAVLSIALGINIYDYLQRKAEHLYAGN